MNDKERRKRIGRQLQRLRKEAGYKSAAAFAKKIGIKTGTYTSYEQGEASFSYERAWDMADALHVTLDELGGRKSQAGGYADERQMRMNYAFVYLDDDQKELAAGSIEGMAAAKARKKAALPRLENRETGS